jgi:hypothetical protein
MAFPTFVAHVFIDWTESKTREYETHVTGVNTTCPFQFYGFSMRLIASQLKQEDSLQDALSSAKFPMKCGTNQCFEMTHRNKN